MKYVRNFFRIMYIQRGGIIEYWRRTFRPTQDRCSITAYGGTVEEVVQPISVVDMQGSFYVLVIGNLFASFYIINLDWLACNFTNKRHFDCYGTVWIKKPNGTDPPSNYCRWIIAFFSCSLIFSLTGNNQKTSFSERFFALIKSVLGLNNSIIFLAWIVRFYHLSLCSFHLVSYFDVGN